MNREGTGLIILYGLTILWAGFALMVGGFVPSFLFYVSGCLTIYETWVYKTCVRDITVTRKLSHHRVMAGEHIRIQLKVANSNIFPFTWKLLFDQSDLKQKSSTGEAEFLVPQQKKAVIEYGVYHLRRGSYQFNQIQLDTGDLLGIVQRKKFWNQPQTLLVYPRVQSISTWPTTTYYQGMQKQMHMQKIYHHDFSYVSGIRNYQYGDRLQQIHWKASARGQGVKVKEFEAKASFEYLFILDQRKEAYQGASAEVFERAVSLTASLMNYTIKNRYPTALFLTGSSPIYLGAGTDQKHFLRFLDHLVEVQPDGLHSLHYHLNHQGLMWKCRKKVVFISSMIQESTLSFLLEIQRKMMQVEMFLVIDPQTKHKNLFQQKWQSFQIPIWQVTDDTFE